MGSEVTMIIVEKGYPSREWERSDTKYTDGSRYEPVRDEKGNIVYTGRTEYYCQVIGAVEMCKLGSGETC